MEEYTFLEVNFRNTEGDDRWTIVKVPMDWDENVPSDRKNLPHREIPIRFEKLQKMIEEERSK